MKKYLYIFKSTVIENLQYITNIFLGFINFFVLMFIFLNLWNYIYSDPSEIINGYTMKQMIWYVLITEMLWVGTRNKSLTNQISDDIRTGNIAYNINKPYNYIFYVISKYIGDIIIKFFMALIVSIFIGLIFIGPIEEFNFLNLPFIIIVFIFGILINAFIKIGISVISFWIEDSSPFHWIYDKFILVLGTIFPIEMFPKILKPVMECTPIFVVSYGPAKLVISFTIDKFVHIFIVQIFYLIFAIIIVLFLYNKGVKKLNVNGG